MKKRMKHPALAGAIAGVALYLVLAAVLRGAVAQEPCPNCGEPLRHEGVYYICEECGYRNR